MLQRVMEVFWAKVYEGAQLNTLTAAIGVTPPSFYAAFGSKEAAFRGTVDLYKATTGAGFLAGLDGGGAARDSIPAMLMSTIDVAVSAPNSAGWNVDAKRAMSQPTPTYRRLRVFTAG